MSRVNSYIRPTADGTQTLWMGTSGATWNYVSIDANIFRVQKDGSTLFNVSSSGATFAGTVTANGVTLTGTQSSVSGNAGSVTNGVYTNTTQTISGTKTFSSTSNHYNGHLFYDSYDAAGNHYPHFKDGSSNSGATINWRQYYGSSQKTHTWTSDSSGNMLFTYQGGITATGALTGGSLDINGPADISGNLTGLDSATSDNYYINDTNTRLHEGTGNALRISTGTGYIDIGSMNSGWIHFQGNKPYYFNQSLNMDADLKPYSTSGARNLGTTSYVWNHVYAKGYFIDSTEVIDASRNLASIGTIGSGAITSTGKIQGTELEGTSLDINGAADISGNIVGGGKLEINQAGNGTSNAPSAVAEFSGQAANGVLVALSLVNSVTAALGNGTQLAFHNANGYSPTGTITTTQAGDTTTDSKMEFQIYRSGLQTALTIDHDSNATFAGAVGVGVAAGSNAKLEVVATSGEVFRADSNSGAFRVVAHQTGVNTQGVLAHTGTLTCSSNATFAASITAAGSSNSFDSTTFTGTITVPTQAQSVNNTTVASTSYVRTAIGNVPSGLAFQGNWNASTDSPSLAGTTPVNGIFYIVSVAGSTSLSGITDWKIGDWAVYVSNGAGTDAWQKVDNTSTLEGAGTANKIPKWSNTTTLTDSLIKDDGEIHFGVNGTGANVHFYSDNNARSANWSLDDHAFNFSDNAKATFGDSGDLEIYHDGSNSVIHDNGTGHLNVRADNLQLMNAAGNQYYMNAISSGSVSIFHNASKKLETAAGGVVVTGELEATTLDISGNSTFSSNLTVGGVLYIDNIQTRSGVNIDFRHQDGTVKMRLKTGTGNLLLGTTTDSGNKLTVKGSIGIQRSVNTAESTINMEGNFNFVAAGGYSHRFEQNGTEVARIVPNGNLLIGTTTDSGAKLNVNGAVDAGGKVTYKKQYGSLNTTGVAVAGLVAGSNGNSAMYIFTCGGAAAYQKIVYSMHNASGTWVVTKTIDEGTNHFDITVTSSAVTGAPIFTFKARSATQSYTPQVLVEIMASNTNTINYTYI